MMCSTLKRADEKYEVYLKDSFQLLYQACKLLAFYDLFHWWTQPKRAIGQMLRQVQNSAKLSLWVLLKLFHGAVYSQWETLQII